MLIYMGIPMVLNIDAQLLVRDNRGRLSGPAVKTHPFFEQLSRIWNDVALLKHPPLPNPPSSELADKVSLHYGEKVTVEKSVARTLDLSTLSTGTVTSRGGIAGLNEADGAEEFAKGTISSTPVRKRKPSKRYTPHHRSDTVRSVASDQNVSLERSISWKAERNVKHVKFSGDYISGTEATEHDNHPYNISDSGLVIPEDIPPSPDFPHPTHDDDEPLPYLRPDSPNSSLSSSIYTPQSHSVLPEPVDVDEELSAAAETYRYLEAFLSSGSYFTDPPLCEQAHISQDTVDEINNSPLLIRDRKPSIGSVISGILYDIPIQPVVAAPDPISVPSPMTSERDNAMDWSFEDKITLAVLDAMDQRPSLPSDQEFGALPPSEEDQAQVTVVRRQRRAESVRRTFQKFRRKFVPY